MKGHRAEITDLKVRDNILYSSDANGQLRAYDIEKEKVVMGIKCSGEISSFELRGDSIIAGVGSSIKIYDTRDKIFVNKSNGEMDTAHDLNQVRLHRDFIGAIGDSGELLIMDLRNLGLFKKLKLHDNVGSCLDFRPGRSWEVLSGGFDSRGLLTDFSRGSIHQEFLHERQDPGINAPFVTSCGFNGTDKFCIGRYNGNLQIIESKGGSKKMEKWESKEIQGHRWAINSIGYCKDLIISTGLDGDVSLWDSSLVKLDCRKNQGQKLNALCVLPIGALESGVKVAIGGFNVDRQGQIFIHHLDPSSGLSEYARGP